MTHDDHDIEYAEHHEREWARLSDDYKVKAIAHLKAEIPEDVKKDIVDMHAKHGCMWIHEAHAHFTWGMAIRNSLRTAGLTDNLVPSGNLDDYYVQCVEAACGIRK